MATATNEQERQWLEDRTKPPFLRRVRIEGYKSIALCDVSLQPLTILVGRNGSGKSNFLDALAFVGETMESSVSEAVRRRGGWSSIACRTTGAQKIVFEVEAGFICGPPIRRVNENTPYEPSEEAVPPNLEGVSFRANYRLELVGGGTTPPTIERELLDLENLATHARVGFKVHRGRVTRGR